MKTTKLDPLEDVRQQLLELLPSFSHFYGIHPWQIDRLTYEEIRVYVKQLRDAQKELSKHG